MTPMPQRIAGRDYLVPIMLHPELDRDEWVKARMAGIGGSDAAAIVGENDNKSAINVWDERVTGGASFVDTERTITGRQLEDPVIRWFMQGAPLWPRTGSAFDVVKPPTVYHRDRPWQRGSVDGLAYEPDAVDAIAPPGSVYQTMRQLWSPSWHSELVRSPLRPLAGVEVKTHGWFGSLGYEREDDGVVVDVPADKRIQCAWYMELYDLDVWYLAALVDTHIRKTFVLQRDREIGSSLLEEVDTFWRRYIMTGQEPPPDGTKSYREHLRAKFKTHGGELIASTPEVDAAVDELLRVKREQKALEKRRESLEQVVKVHIGDNLGVRTASGKITWKSQASGKLRETDARAELYSVAGWTDAEIAAFEELFKQPDHRVMRTPK